MDEEMNRRLDKLKEKMGIESDEGLSERLGCRYTSIINWRKGKSKMSRSFRLLLRQLEVKYKTDLPKSNRLRKWGSWSEHPERKRKKPEDLPF
jgi:hypothetical protein